MATSKLLTLNDAGTSASVADANPADLFTTLLSGNKVVTGMYAHIQRVGLFVAGGALDRRITTGAFGIPFMTPK